MNWTPVLREGMHVDPLNIMAKCVIDGTGHDSEMCRTVARKNGIRLATDTGDVIGERSLDVVSGEEEVVNGTKEIYPGLYVCGMAASAVSGTPRMGPIFGGMLMSGKKVADMIVGMHIHDAVDALDHYAPCTLPNDVLAPYREYIVNSPIKVLELSGRLSAEEIITGTDRFVERYGK